MKMQKSALLLCTFILLTAFSSTVFAQALQVKGRVINKLTGEALQGATLTVKGGNTSTTTLADGEYSISVPKPGSTLVVTFTGMVPTERVINGAGTQNFELELNDNNLNEVVVVGYGVQKKTSLTASVASIKGVEVQRQPVGDLTNALGGRASGVIFTQASGQPGNDASRILIRGIGTNGNSSPLLIVDGVPRNFSQLNPADVESISVLKDAAAVAPYGLGGANGVILVTTKRGKTGRPVLNYEGYIGVQNPTVVTHFVSSYQHALMKNEGARNAGSTTMPYSDAALQKFRDGSDPDAFPNIDPIADMRVKNALVTNHSLSLGGGTDVIKYTMGLGYFSQEGMFPGMKFQRYNLSASLQAQATKSTVVSLALNGRVEDRRYTGAGISGQGIFENLINTVSVSTPKTYSNGMHPYLYASFYDNPSYQQIIGNTLLSQLSIEQKLPIKGLSVKFVGSFDLNPFDPFNFDVNGDGIINGDDQTNSGIVSRSRKWNQGFSYQTIDTTTRPYSYPTTGPATLPSFEQEWRETQAFTYQGYINYARTFGKSEVTGLVVLETRNTKSQKFSAKRNNYRIPISELFAGGTGESDITNDGTSRGTKQRSLVYRATYGYNDRYLLEVAGRYDGHYYFAPGHRFGFFPAFSAAWRISEENFMQNVSWIDELKIRGSWGQSANLAGSAYQYQTGFDLTGTSAILNGTQTQGLFERDEANPNITWEKADKTDVGLEARLFKGLLNVEADFFREKRNNMLLSPGVTVPVEYGIELSQVNAGVMQNRGFEFTVSSDYNITQDLRVGLSGNFTFARNKMIEIFENPATFDNPNLRKTGRALDVPFGYQALGYFKQDDFDSNGDLKEGIARQVFTDKVFPGDIRYADISGPDGKPDGLIDFNDQVAMGYPDYPAIVYGFSPSVSYKGFELSLLFQGAGQREIQLNGSAVWAFDNDKNAAVTTLDYWTPDNTDASYPRMTTTPSANNSQASTFWHKSVAYLRLRTGVLSYTIPNRLTKRIGMSNLTVYLSGQNILTWTPIDNFDPEISDNRGWYFPTQKAVTAGLRVQF
jgi:TonB-linked SusC/RagA family outer membrane protein